MAGPFALDYFVFVFIASIGVLQVVAAHQALEGILLIRNRSLAFVAGLAATALAFLWFFWSEPRNVPDTQDGLNGNEMALLFALATGSGLLVTLLTSSISNHRRFSHGQRQPAPGLDALKDTTYLDAVLVTLGKIWKRYRA